MPDQDIDIIQQQIAYYRERAGEYDEWFLRQGRYDHGEALNRAWFQEVAQVERALERFAPAGEVLELACGTGLWTQRLLRYTDRITAVDASAEVIELSQRRLRIANDGSLARVRYLQANLFDWQPVAAYDVVFFSFWLSHVPSSRFEPFWELVKKSLKPGGRVFFIDSKYEPTSTARDHHLPDRQEETSLRRLNDGREYRIVKHFYEPDQLENRLSQVGWRVRVEETPAYFIYGYSGAEPF